MQGRAAAKAQWEADKCSKHFGYRLKGKAGSKRPIPMTSVKSLAARFHQLKCGHAPTGTYLKRFGYREDDKCWWCGGTTAQNPDAGESLPPLQPVERQAAGALERDGEDNGLKSGQMSARADIRAVFHGDM
jgi:hypothetical protein